MCERMKVPVPLAASSPSESISRASPTSTRRRPLAQRPSAVTGPARKRPGEEQVEGGGEQEAVGDEAVAGVESGIVHHLEIERAVGGAGGVEELLANLEADPGEALLDDLQLAIRTGR